MTRRPSRLADLDIASEGRAQQDGLAERLARQRGAGAPPTPEAVRPATRDANAWRRGKSLLQVAIAEAAHVELSIVAKRRRMTLSQLTKDALNDWLAAHGYELKITD